MVTGGVAGTAAWSVATWFACICVVVTWFICQGFRPFVLCFFWQFLAAFFAKEAHAPLHAVRFFFCCHGIDCDTIHIHGIFVTSFTLMVSLCSVMHTPLVVPVFEVLGPFSPVCIPF
jgi:hypothetical protein